MKSREEFIEEAQELFEALDFGEYTVEGVDNWNFEFLKMGPIVAETYLTVYLSHPEDEPDSPSSKASVTVTFDSTDSLRFPNSGKIYSHSFKRLKRNVKSRGFGKRNGSPINSFILTHGDYF